jgi:hypothetical protein
MLRAFRRDPYEDLVGEWPIRGLGLSQLQELFDETDEMYGASYPVRQDHVLALERATGIVLDFDRFEYFVEADAV